MIISLTHVMIRKEINAKRFKSRLLDECRFVLFPNQRRHFPSTFNSSVLRKSRKTPLQSTSYTPPHDKYRLSQKLVPILWRGWTVVLHGHVGINLLLCYGLGNFALDERSISQPFASNFPTSIFVHARYSMRTRVR